MRIIGTITTVPDRVKYLNETIKRIMNQTRPLDKLYINMPYVSSKGIKYDITELDLSDVKYFERILVNRCQDIGPLTKLLSTLYKETDPETLIITFDDDIFVDDKIVEIYQKYTIKHPESVMALGGMSFGKSKFVKLIYKRFPKGVIPFIFSSIYFNNKKDVEVDHILGTTTCCYKRKLLDPEKFIIENYDLDKELKKCFFMHDDHWISYVLEKQGIKKIIVGEKTKDHLQENHSTKENSSCLSNSSDF